LIRLNIVILVGAQERLPVRLVALRLPAPLAAQRRRRARANARRDRALRLTKRYLKLLDWTILLTNVTPSQLSAQQLLEAYSCRWQIEVLFKTWKSHFQLGRLPSWNPLWVQIQLLVKLLAIALLPTLLWLNFVHSAAYFSRLLPLITASPQRDWFEHFSLFLPPRFSLR
jgi:IS4 transposase